MIFNIINQWIELGNFDVVYKLSYQYGLLTNKEYEDYLDNKYPVFCQKCHRWLRGEEKEMADSLNCCIRCDHVLADIEVDTFMIERV